MYKYYVCPRMYTNLSPLSTREVRGGNKNPCMGINIKRMYSWIGLYAIIYVVIHTSRKLYKALTCILFLPTVGSPSPPPSFGLFVP